MTVAELYGDIQAERRDDLALMGQLIADGHRRDLMQGTTNELFMATLAKLSRAETLADEERNDENL